MIKRLTSRSRHILGVSGRVGRPRARTLRAAVIVLPFFAAALLAFIYGFWRFPPVPFQVFVVLSTLLCLVAVSSGRTWIYRFAAGAPLLALAFGGAFFFPMAVSLHAAEYHLVDNQLAVAVALAAWGLSTWSLWRLFQPSEAGVWKRVAERHRASLSRWILTVTLPVFWAGYGFAAFAFIDTQLDRSAGRTFLARVVAKSQHARAGSHDYVRLSPWPRDYARAAGPQGAEIPEALFDRLVIGGAACVSQHAGLLGARWFAVEACSPV